MSSLRFKKILMLFLFFLFTGESYALSIRHHLFNAGKDLVISSLSPLKGIFIYGPQNIKKAYRYEVWERENIQERNKLKYRLFALWRAPGEQIKGAVKGLVESVEYVSRFIGEIVSIFFSD